MQKPDDEDTPVAVTAALIDPESLAVAWTNHPAGAASSPAGAEAPSVTLDRVLPMAETMGVPQALRAVAETGVAQHLSADVVAMSRGAAVLSVWIYRLPDGRLLLLAGDTWRLRRKAQARRGSTRP